MATCGGCSNTWTGIKVCHCAGCHRTFSVLSWFDRHRTRGKCLNPASITVSEEDTRPAMKLDAHGKWVGALANPLYDNTSGEESEE